MRDRGQFATASDCRRLCRFNTRPVGRLSVRTTRSRWTLWIPTRDPGSLRALLLAPAVTVGETEGAMDSTSVFFLASSFAYNFVRK